MTVTALTRRDIEWEPAWARGEWGELDSPRVTTKTGGEGRFEVSLDGLESESGRGVLFVRCVGYGSALEDVSLDEGGFVEVVLEPAERLEVLVVDEEGVAVPGATVVRYGVVPGGPSAARASEEELRARYARDEGVTDPSGVVEMGAYGGEVVLVASTEDRVSLPWRGVAKGRVVLPLLDAFELSGVVRLPDWSDLDYEGERRLRVSAKTGGLDRELAVVRHVEAGPYGPLRLPRFESTDYTVHLEGSPIIPVRETFRPRPDVDQIQVDLNAERGANVWCRLVDMDDNPIQEGEATLLWVWEGKRNQLTRHTSEDGFLNMWSLPPVRFDVIGRAPGYATTRYPSFAVDVDGYVPLHLPRAGVIRGRCLADGEPVRDFTVMVYQKDLVVGDTVQFEGRDDGSFEMDATPAAKVLVSASSADYPPCEPVELDVGEGQPASVVLELHPGRSLVGKVVDLGSGRPIEQAAVQQVIWIGTTGSVRWGSPVYTDDSGKFRVDDLGSGDVRIEVSREGYATRLVSVGGKVGGDATPLRVELSPPSKLILRLTGRSAAEYAGVEVTASAGGGSSLAATPDSNGVVTFSGIGPGVYKVAVCGIPLGRPTYLCYLLVHAREVREATLPVGGANHLTVSFDRQRFAPEESTIYVHVYCLSAEEDAPLIWGTFDEAGSFEAWGVPSERVFVRASLLDGSVIAATSGRFERGELHLELAAEDHPLVLRVVDDGNDPVPGIHVYPIDPQTRAGTRSVRTDEDGEAELHGLPKADVPLLLVQGQRAASVETSVDGRLDEGEVVFRPVGSLALTLVNHGTPVPGVEADLYFGPVRIPAFYRESDEKGVVAWEHLAPGEFEVNLARPGFWEERRALTVGAAGTRATVELRRFGDLRLTIRNADGLAVSGLAIDLVDEASGTHVSDWIEAGRVRGSLVTDSRGEVRVEGLPEGSYGVRGEQGDLLGSVECEGGVERSAILLRSRD